MRSEEWVGRNAKIKGSGPWVLGNNRHEEDRRVRTQQAGLISPACKDREMRTTVVAIMLIVEIIAENTPVISS